MADLILTRIEGFKFNTLTVDNSLDEDIVLIDVDRDATPNLTYYESSVPGRNGSDRTDNRYEDKIIPVIVGIEGETAVERKIKQRKFLQQIVGRTGKLIFKDEPDLFYIAKLYSPVKVIEGVIYTELTMLFQCSFCKYGLNFDETDFTDELPIRTAISNTGTKTVTNYGNYKADYIVEITGTATLAIVTLNDRQFSISNISNETIYVDSKEMLVYKIVDGEEVNKILSFTGKFPLADLTPGEHTITVGGTAVNATTKIRFRDTYLY